MTIPDDNSFVNGGMINMSVRVRIATIRLNEKMERNDAYCKKLGISDASRFNGNVEGKKKEQGGIQNGKNQSYTNHYLGSNLHHYA